MSPRPIVFLHLPKAGGTSVASTIRSAYDPSEVAPVFEATPFDRDPGKWPDYRQYRYASGHWGYEVARACYPNHQIVTNFRHPVSRIVSLYNFWRSIDPASLPAYLQSESGPKYARSMTLSEFVDSRVPFLSLFLDNFHTRQLVASSWLPKQLTYLDVLVAAWRVYRMPWFYVCEHPKASTQWLKSALPELGDVEVGYENVTRTETEVGASNADAERILTRNRHDLRLYQFSVFLLGQRGWLAASGGAG